MSTGESQPVPTKGPYPSKVAGLGGIPTKSLDDPIIAVFMFLFICGAATHMTILQLNQRKGHKFLASGALFGFCMARILACILRIVWSTKPHDVNVVIAANVFINAGVLIIIIINLIFAQRILRATHPHIGWHRAIHFIFLGYYISIPLLLGGLIVSIIQPLFTLDNHIRSIDHKVQLVGITYFAVAAFLPIVLILAGLILPKHTRVEKFGSGRFRTKIRILLISSSLIALGASFRASVAYRPRPATNPAWYHSKACFYLFDFTIEIIVIFLYAIVRVDRRYWIPNGSHKAGDYSTGIAGGEKGAGVDPPVATNGVFSEEELFEESSAVKESPEWDRRADEERLHGMEAAPTVRAA